MKNALRAAALLLAITLGAWVVFQVGILALNDERSLADRAEIREELEADDAEILQLGTQVTLLVQQLEALGQVPVVTPDTSPSSSSPGYLIQSLIDAGFTARCGGPSCKGDAGTPAPPAKDGVNGTNGRDGDPGQTPSTELLLSLIQPLIPPPAANGADGVGVLAIACTSPMPFPVSFDFALSNGTTQSVSCPVAGDPPVDPEIPEVTP